MDALDALAIVAPLIGVVVGWQLNRKSALEAAAQEREYQELRESRRRQADAAALLDERVHEALGVLPTGGGREAGEQLHLAHNRLIRAWQRATVIEDPEIVRRVEALDMALHIGGRNGPEGGDLWTVNGRCQRV
ncbi:MAG: hypothetical protein ACRDL3_08200 [Solirubrobacterales bacterium]